MRKDRGRWIGLAVGLPLGLALGFLFVFAPLFTDGPSSIFDAERLVSFGLAFVPFFAAATLLAWIARGGWWPLGALGLPGLAIAAWYVSREPGAIGLALAYVGFVVAAVVVGRLLGWRFRRSRSGADAPA